MVLESDHPCSPAGFPASGKIMETWKTKKTFFIVKELLRGMCKGGLIFIDFSTIPSKYP